MIACRDPLGIRPLVMGRLGEAYIFASETVALDMVGATYSRTVEPGELIEVFDMGVRSLPPVRAAAAQARASSSISISRGPDSVIDGHSVYNVAQADRRRAAPRKPGRRRLCRARCPIRGVPAAIGYAQQSGIPFELGIIRSHYVGRTFIQPGDQVRHLGVKLKHNANSALIHGKSIVLVDDSIVRGTTSLKIVQMMRDAGAREVHMRIASPPTRHSCFYGVDTPERAKLLAAQMNVAEMNDYIQADSLAFVSIDGLYRALGEEQRDDAEPQHCDACFTGDYPTSLTDHGRARAARTSSRCVDRTRGLMTDGAVRRAGSRWSPAPGAASAPRSPRRWRRRARTSSSPRGRARTSKRSRSGSTRPAASATIAPMDLTESDDRPAGPGGPSAGALDMLVLNAAILGTLTPVRRSSRSS